MFTYFTVVLLHGRWLQFGPDVWLFVDERVCDCHSWFHKSETACPSLKAAAKVQIQCGASEDEASVLVFKFNTHGMDSITETPTWYNVTTKQQILHL